MGVFDGYCYVTSWWDEANMASAIYTYDGSYCSNRNRQDSAVASFRSAAPIKPLAIITLAKKITGHAPIQDAWIQRQ